MLRSEFSSGPYRVGPRSFCFWHMDIQEPGANPGKGDRTLYSYEVALILRPEVEDEGQEAIIERLSEILTSQGGQVENVEKWDRRRLAHPINKVNEGIYYFIQGQFPTSVLPELDRTIKLTEDILRYMVVRMDE